MVELEINKIYLIQSGYFSIFNKEYFNSLQPMVHTHTTVRLDDGKRFYFHCPIEDTDSSADEWSIHNEVFEDEDEFLKYSVGEALRINVKMDSYFKDLVDKSKTKNPEKWI